MDIILIGDSVAMVELGHETTQPMTMDSMIHHCQSVKRGVNFANVENEPLLVADMPFGTYEFEDSDIALKNAFRFVKEAGMDAVKLEVSELRHAIERTLYSRMALMRLIACLLSRVVAQLELERRERLSMAASL